MDFSLETIIETYAQITLFLLMISIGLGEGLRNVFLLWRRRSLFVRSFIASFVLVPLAAMLINAVMRTTSHWMLATTM